MRRKACSSTQSRLLRAESLCQYLRAVNGAQDGRGLVDQHLLHGLTVGLLDLILMHDGVEDFVPG